MRSVVRWAALWRSSNALDGPSEHLLFENCMPALFHTRAEARAWIKERYGYIASRSDLRAEPHGWKVPMPVRVQVDLKILSSLEQRRVA
jgi:hypothetical protein